MANKPTDESLNVSPDEKENDADQAIDSQPVGDESANPDNNGPTQSDEPDPPAKESEFLTSEGKDPAAIVMRINNGDGFELDDLQDDNVLQQVAGVFLLWWHWAFFEITVTSPNFPIYNPPKIIPSALIPGSDEHEFVYDISDQGYKLSTSKGAEMYSVGMSMCKMFYTIEKMIFILVRRIQDEGISTEAEVQVMFDGHLLAQRKAFESIINLNYNVVVTNFDPGTWGERYLEIVKRLSDRGYGYPSEAPREIYKITKRNANPKNP